MKLTDYACPFCASPGGLSIGLDRKGKPYANCWGCGLQIFCRSAQAAGGLMLLSEARARGDFGSAPEDWLVMARDRGQALVRQVTVSAMGAAAPAPVPDPTQVEANRG